MHHNGTIEKLDITNDRLREEMYAWTNSDEGLWFVARYMLGPGHARLSERNHKPMLKWAQRQLTTPDALFSIRDPRMSGKTTGFTISTPLWCCAAMPIGTTPVQGVNTCIAIVAPKKDIASYIFLAEIARTYQSAEAYQELYDWVRPDPNFWSLKNGLLFQRTSTVGLPTVLPLGMESVSTSLHPPILICDDPIHEQNYRSATEVSRVIAWMEKSYALTGPVHGVRAFVGNYWAIGDVQDQLHPEAPECKTEYRKVQVWHRSLTACAGCDGSAAETYPGGGSITGRLPGHEHEGDVHPIALLQPKEAPDDPDIEEGVDHITRIRESHPTFMYLTQHENILVDPANLHLRKEWRRYWDWETAANGELMIRMPMMAFTAAERKLRGADNIVNDGWRTGPAELLPLGAFEFYVLCDPAPSEQARVGRSRFAIAVVAVERTGPRVLLIDEYARNAPEHVNISMILDFWVKWRPYMRKIGVESVGYQSTIKDALLQAAATRSIILTEGDIEMLTRLRSEGQQEDRIKYWLIPLMESGCLYVRRVHHIFHEETDRFGLANSAHDLLDAMSNLGRVRAVRRAGGRRGSGMEAARRARERIRTTDNTGY